MNTRYEPLYQMYYDDKTKGIDGHDDILLGNFGKIEQIKEDGWVDVFIAENEFGEVFMILSYEIKGIGGGIRYSIKKLKEIQAKPDQVIKTDLENYIELLEKSGIKYTKCDAFVEHKEGMWTTNGVMVEEVNTSIPGYILKRQMIFRKNTGELIDCINETRMH